MIQLLTTGGTIASALNAEGLNVSGAMSGDQLLASLDSSLSVDQHPRTESLIQVPSNAIDTTDLRTMEDRCRQLMADPGIEGIVLTHGTDTLEDTAYFLHLTLGDCPKPVVITGSQKPIHETGSDAPRNLADAIKVASAPASRGFGVLVVFDEAIHSAALARKTSSYRLGGFSSPGYGPIGHVDGNQVGYSLHPAPQRALPTGKHLGGLPRIDILQAALDSACLVKAAQRDGADGLVINGLGRGHVPPRWVEDISEAANSGLPIAITSSTGSGPVKAVYEFPGSLADLLKAGVISAGDLTARQARILMMVLLSRDCRDTELAGHLGQAGIWGEGKLPRSPGSRAISN